MSGVFNYNTFQEDQVEYVQVTEVGELPSGERLFAQIDHFSLVIFNIAGDLYAIGDVCSHDDGPVGDGDLDGYQIICPRHGARFDVRTGEVLALPAIVDIPAYPVRVVDGMIEVGIPLE
jgi:3-phenylpropionate/trans-cinnamate dioxygenase ferredoxin subunit